MPMNKEGNIQVLIHTGSLQILNALVYTGAYTRLQPQVMDKLKEAVRTQKPDKLYREAHVLYEPRKKRVIYDVKYRY